MDLKTAIKNAGCLVFVSSAHGKYIGVIDDIRKNNHTYLAKICILACLQYPSQKALLQNTKYERRPHQYKSLHDYNLDDVEIYSSNLPPEICDQFYYNKSIKNALAQKINDYGWIDDFEKQILLQHLVEVKRQNGEAV